MNKKETSLSTERYPNRDFFIADIFDGLPFKDDMASMAHPIFSLSTKRDVRVLEYSSGGTTIKIAPSTYGLPTIFDKDVILYCGSLLMAEVNKGIIPPKTLRISSHDLLVTTQRAKDGRGYQALKQALQRLRGVSITTNIKTNKIKHSAGFGLIDKWEIIESSRVKKRMIRLEITLSDWFYNSIVGREVLTIDRDYFRIRQPLERRIYEIARKHCGKQDNFKINIENLYERTGSASPLNKFAFNLKKIIERNSLPEYSIELERKNIIVFRRIKQNKTKELPQPTLDNTVFLKSYTMEKARAIALKAETGWDIYAIHQEFIEFNKGKKDIKNIDGLFIGFVKKKVAKYP